MSGGRCFVDTNILFYAHDRQAGFKHDRALQLVEDLLDSGTGVLSTQVLQEFCVSVRRLARTFTLDETRQLILGFLSWDIVVNTGESVLGALEVEARYKISFWDALIVYAAQRSGADVLYSEDLNDGQTYGSVRVVNPLKS